MFFRKKKPNLSPWIHALRRTRVARELQHSFSTETLIIGGGIAGITTAAFILLETDKKVVVVDAGKIAHGATGHNAGQIVSYFERPFSDIARVYGLPLAAKAQEGIFSAWDLLFYLYKTFELKTPLSTFTGYAALSSVEDIISYLEDIRLQKEAGLAIENMMVSETIAEKIPKHVAGTCAIVPQKRILEVTESKNEKYVAALVSRKGCVNSALFTEELLSTLLQRFPDRFQVFEHTPIDVVNLGKENGQAISKNAEITADHIILCTNGFERIKIVNLVGKSVDTMFHHMVTGYVGYMSGYLEPLGRPPAGISFLGNSRTKEGSDGVIADPYFYVTRRPHEYEREETHNLVCIGGPEAELPEGKEYAKDIHPYPKEATESMRQFLKTTFAPAPKGKIPFTYEWHGLMGYTANGLRCIGPEPENAVLLYNLGCNGIGILPSIYGAKRLALYIKYGVLDDSIFDPRIFRVVEKNNTVFFIMQT